MAQINKPTDYFNGLPYTGNDTATSYNNGLDMNTNGGLVWLKTRNAVGDHGLFDSVRGVNKRIRSNTTNAEDTLASNGVTSFDSTGFSLGTVAYNDTPYTFMSWSWLAGGTASSNTDGSITSNVSANTTSGFSIVSYTGTGANATVGHGLGVAPKIVLTKNRNTADNWLMYHASTGNTKALYLNENFATGTSSAYWNNTSPTSSVFSVGTEVPMNKSGDSIIAYCFAEKKGFSKFGSFVGNGQAFPNSPFIYLGFKPALFIWKNISDGGSDDNWNMVTAKSQEYNIQDAGYTMANSNGAETGFSGNQINFLSNGVKLNVASPYHNQSGSTYIYMAFAENPLVGTNNTPAVAR